ncbi:MAG: hypothetical protein B6I35_01540 [Anaerolineaceae bacterium 4572_32.2]|nr:MAG: hypothetical protein B6I35_01540 [Anaerolineaceae bacterium 4572_32.2]
MTNLESRISNLKTYLRRWGLRLRLAESLTWAPWGGAVGLGLGLTLALAARLWPLMMARRLAGVVGLLVLVGVTAGLAVAWLWPRPSFRLARVFDRRFGLAERLTTAVEVGADRLRATPAMAQAQLTDTLNAAARIDPRAMLPLRASRRPLLAFCALATALTLSFWLPNPQEDALLQRAAVREAEREMLLQALEEATAALDEGRATPEEAVGALSEAERALAELQDPGAATAREGLDRAAGEMADSELTRDIAESLSNGDYQEAAQALAAYSGAKGEQLTREEELELARELAQAAEALAESDPDLAEQLALGRLLSAAAEAIERGDIAEAREAIGQAAQQMGETGERVERQEAVERALAELQEGREQIAQAGST